MTTLKPVETEYTNGKAIAHAVPLNPSQAIPEDHEVIVLIDDAHFAELSNQDGSVNLAPLLILSVLSLMSVIAQFGSL